MAKQGHRRKGRHSRFWAGVASVAIFAVLISLAVAGLSMVGGDVPKVARVEPAAPEPGAAKAINERGRVFSVGSTDCSMADFDNRDGRLSNNRSIPCPDRNFSREYSVPTGRIQSFSKGFAR